MDKRRFRAFSLALGLALLATLTMQPSVRGQDGEKRVEMKFDKKRWNGVIEWYVDQTGLPLISSFAPPAGTFSHSPPEGTTYTLQEATAIINEAMIRQGYVLVPLKKSIVLAKTK